MAKRKSNGKAKKPKNSGRNRAVSGARKRSTGGKGSSAGLRAQSQRATSSSRSAAGTRKGKKPAQSRGGISKDQIRQDLIERFNEAKTEAERAELRAEYIEAFPQEAAIVRAVESGAEPVAPDTNLKRNEQGGLQEFQGRVFGKARFGSWQELLDKVGEKLKFYYPEIGDKLEPDEEDEGDNE